MNIYTLNNKELKKISKEFSKTAFGRKAKIFSMMSISTIIIILLLMAFSNNQFSFTDFIILFVGSHITQLQYGNMLKDYINSKK